MERSKKSTPMKGEAAVAILASEGLAQVAVSCQHARSSFVFLRVEFLLKTESGYLRDAGVTWFTLANP